MPTYEYQREDGTTFEMWQNINAEPLDTCPETGQKVKRLISGGTGMVFKGTGWYVTDYKDRGKSNGSNGKSQSTKSSAGSDSSTSANKQNGSSSKE